MLIVDLKTLDVRNIGNVGSFEFNKTGELLAYTIDAADQSGNGLYLVELNSHVLKILDSSDQRYRQLTWNENGEHLAVLRGKEKKGFLQNENDVVVIQDVASRQESKSVYAPAGDKSFPEKMVISEYSNLQFSNDGAMVFTGLKEQQKKPSGQKNSEERANVDVWHWQDDRVQSVQQRRASRDRRSTYAAVIHLNPNKQLVQLGDQGSFSRFRRWQRTLGGWSRRFQIPSRGFLGWLGRGDYYRVDLKDGKRELQLPKHWADRLGYSPDGKHFVYLQGESNFGFTTWTTVPRRICQKRQPGSIS